MEGKILSRIWLISIRVAFGDQFIIASNLDSRLEMRRFQVGRPSRPGLENCIRKVSLLLIVYSAIDPG